VRGSAFQTRIFCPQCGPGQTAMKVRGATPAGAQWFNKCLGCHNRFPAPPPSQATNNFAQRAIRRQHLYLESRGQQRLFPPTPTTKGGR
jgi:hypothetical protein